MVLTEADPVWSWSSHIDQALNTHLRVSGYSPYHFVFGRDPWVPCSTLRDDASIVAQSAAVYDDVARRAEMTRQAAVTATLSLDSYAALKRAVLAPRQTYHPAVGDMVFWWRAPGRFSKVLAREEGWQGPGLVMRVLPTKVVINWFGGVVECAPHQCRRWSRDEADMLLHSTRVC